MIKLWLSRKLPPRLRRATGVCATTWCHRHKKYVVQVISMVFGATDKSVVNDHRVPKSFERYCARHMWLQVINALYSTACMRNQSMWQLFPVWPKIQCVIQLSSVSHYLRSWIRPSNVIKIDIVIRRTKHICVTFLRTELYATNIRSSF